MKDDPRRDRQDELLEESLRRLFEPPTRVPMPPIAAPSKRPTAHAEPLGGGGWGWRALLATAACLVGFLWLAGDGSGPGGPVGSGGEAGQAGDRAGSGWAGAGPRSAAADGRADPPPAVPIHASTPGGSASAPVAYRPNLELLYADATRESLSRALCDAPQDLDEVRLELALRCGSELILRPEAAGVLQGPIGSSEWPTGTVLTGFPEGPEAGASVLVAECDPLVTCCIAASLPGSGPLRMFSSQIGEVMLTEITPLDEPGLLQYFAAP